MLASGGRHETGHLSGMFTEFMFEQLASDAVEQRLFQLIVTATGAQQGPQVYLVVLTEAEIERAIDGEAHSISWPCNVRELRNCIERACILSLNPVLTAKDLFGQAPSSNGQEEATVGSLTNHLRTTERHYIEAGANRPSMAHQGNCHRHLHHPQEPVGKDEEAGNLGAGTRHTEPNTLAGGEG